MGEARGAAVANCANADKSAIATDLSFAWIRIRSLDGKDGSGWLSH
jgi:hypothetical protein